MYPLQGPSRGVDLESVDPRVWTSRVHPLEDHLEDRVYGDNHSHRRAVIYDTSVARVKSNVASFLE